MRERLGSYPKQHEQVGIYSQGTGWGSVNGKLLRGDTSGVRRILLNQPNRILAEARPEGWWRMGKLTKYQGWSDIRSMWLWLN